MQELFSYAQQYGHLFVSEWLDAVWVPVAALVVHKGQKLKAMGFVLLCMLVMRLQIEIIQSLGFDRGIAGFMETSLYHRGLAVYGFFIFMYLLLSYFSPYTKGVIYLAASLSIFFMAFAASFIVMII